MVIEDKKYGIDEVFVMIGEEYLNGNNDDNQRASNMVVDGFNVYAKSLRYMTFYQKGVKCVCCGKEGTHFKLCGYANTNRRHFNLYADDGTLMTKDHIIPASKGGPDKVTNMQTMCTVCNVEKGSYHPDYKIEYIIGRDEKTGNEQIFTTIEKAAYAMMCNYGKINAKKITKNDAVKMAIGSVVKLLAAIENGTSYCGHIWTKEMR